MTVRPYEPKDFAQIKEWGLEWEQEYIEEQFPKTGFIVDGVAAYFLYSTDSACCWLENMISSKSATKAKRDEALELIINAILNEADKLGFKVAYATTDNVFIAKRAFEYGAFVKPLQIKLVKKLGPS